MQSSQFWFLITNVLNCIKYELFKPSKLMHKFYKFGSKIFYLVHKHSVNMFLCQKVRIGKLSEVIQQCLQPCSLFVPIDTNFLIGSCILQMIMLIKLFVLRSVLIRQFVHCLSVKYSSYCTVRSILKFIFCEQGNCVEEDFQYLRWCFESLLQNYIVIKIWWKFFKDFQEMSLH